MGHGGYSSSSRSYRSKASHLVKIKADDLGLVANCLSSVYGNGAVGSDGTLMMNVSSGAEAGNIRSMLESAGISAIVREADKGLGGYAHKAAAEVFSQRQINNAMNPFGVVVRESRDSAEHPNSVAIVLGLDETGSMGTVPHYLVKDGLPMLMDKIIKGGVPDPQVLFLGIGDHECDNAPLQVGQFESSDELLDKWLTDLYLEGRGGGNDGESYLLAWYFAAFHTAIDCFEKRQRKGYCITIGDEPVLQRVPASFLQRLMGPGQYEDYSAAQLLAKASERYNVFHINVKETSSGSRSEVYNGWKQLLADNLKVANRREDVSAIIADIILAGEKGQVAAVAGTYTPEPLGEVIL